MRKKSRVSSPAWSLLSSLVDPGRLLLVPLSCSAAAVLLLRTANTRCTTIRIMVGGAAGYSCCALLSPVSDDGAVNLRLVCSLTPNAAFGQHFCSTTGRIIVLVGTVICKVLFACCYDCTSFDYVQLTKSKILNQVVSKKVRKDFYDG